MSTTVNTATRRWPAVIVGGGQAGLSMSHCLKQRGIEHVVLEKHRIGHAWREQRWDTFCLVTPNWQCKLPGFPYSGADPNGFMLKDEIVRYVEGYARSFAPPVREGVEVTALRMVGDRSFRVASTAGEFAADHVIVAVGAYHTPRVPRFAERLPLEMLQIDSSEYRSPQGLPQGEVLVVGSGQSGCQIAEDLHLAGRRVSLCVGGAPRTARFYRGKDVVEWLALMGYYDMPVHDHPLKDRVRAKANHYVTGRDGGRDIDLRLRAGEGMRLFGRLTGLAEGKLLFAADLKANLDQADAVAESIKNTIDQFIDSRGITAPREARYVPLWEPGEAVRELDVASSGISCVIWCMGYRSDYGWIEVPVFDGKGYPVHQRGVTSTGGLYFLGLPWLYTWGSGRFSGVGADAEHLARMIGARLDDARTTADAALNELVLGS
jgi:putative flavoprotein involved in K+ transport